MTIGEKIRQFRKERKMTQLDLAEKVGVARVTIGFYERDERFPSVDIAARIAKAIGVSLDEILGFTVSEYAQDLIKTGKLTDEAVNEHMRIYKILDKHGREIVDMVSGAEYRRMFDAIGISDAPDDEGP